MKRIHPTTTAAFVLNIVALAVFLSGYQVAAAILSVIAFFAAFREVATYTSWYQFTMVFISSGLAGLFVDLSHMAVPLVTVGLLLAAGCCVLRIVLFDLFSYTGYPWFEPLVLGVSVLVLVYANVIGNYGWMGYVIPTPLIITSIFFTRGVLNDKNQLLAQSHKGYRVQIGRPANAFELPDQDGQLVRLADFKNKRHVLLIFVRGDWCPGCHMMLRTYEKNHEKFRSKNIFVMAIGPDPVGVNRGMVEKLGLEFKVLSDEGQQTAMVYGVQLKEYNHAYAETYKEGIPLPASFLIDKEGIVRYVSRPDKVGEFLNPSLIFPIVEQLN